MTRPVSPALMPEAERQADRVGPSLASALHPLPMLSGGLLPDRTRQTAERHLGVDLSGTNVSEGSDGVGAGSPGPLAVARDPAVRFAPGQLRPGSFAAAHLLGHELTHIAQQRAAFTPTLPTALRPFVPVAPLVMQAKPPPRTHELILQALISAKAGKTDPERARARELMLGLSPVDAELLFNRLTGGNRRDDFAVFFNTEANVPRRVRDDLLAALKSRFAAPGKTAAAEPAHDETDEGATKPEAFEVSALAQRVAALVEQPMREGGGVGDFQAAFEALAAADMPSLLEAARGLQQRNVLENLIGHRNEVALRDSGRVKAGLFLGRLLHGDRGLFDTTEVTELTGEIPNLAEADQIAISRVLIGRFGAAQASEGGEPGQPAPPRTLEEVKRQFPELPPQLMGILVQLPSSVFGALGPLLQGQIFHAIISAGWKTGNPAPAHPLGLVNTGGGPLGRTRTDLRDPVTGAVIEIKPKGSVGGVAQLAAYVASLGPPWHAALNVPTEAWPPTGSVASYSLSLLGINLTLEAVNNFAAEPGMLYYELKVSATGVPVFVPIPAPTKRRKFNFQFPKLAPAPSMVPVLATVTVGAILLLILMALAAA